MLKILVFNQFWLFSKFHLNEANSKQLWGRKSCDSIPSTLSSTTTLLDDLVHLLCCIVNSQYNDDHAWRSYSSSMVAYLQWAGGDPLVLDGESPRPNRILGVRIWAIEPQNTNRARVEIGEFICPVSWSVYHNFVHDGRYSERGWACTNHTDQPGLIFLPWWNVE